MFHFQLVVLRMDINYVELLPQLAVSFGEVQTQLALPELKAGNNVLGLGRSLTVEISDMEVADWFGQYALCLEFTGSLLKKPLTAFLSLQKLEINDEVTEQIVTMDNESLPDTYVRLSLNLKFKYVRNTATQPRPLMMQPSANQPHPLINIQANAFSKTTKSSFLYGKTSSATVKPAATASTNKKAQRPVSSKLGNSKPVKQNNARPQSTNVVIQQPYIPQYISQENFRQQLEEAEFLGQKYYCPPVMEFTNEPAPMAKQQYPQELQRGMENYSFQNNQLQAAMQLAATKARPKAKKNSAQTGKPFSKEQIKKLVEEEYGQDNNIVVPVLENGKFVLKKLNEVSRDQIKNFLEQTPQNLVTPQKKHINIVQPQHKPSQHSEQNMHVIKHSQSSIPLPRADESKINTSLSAQYPEDFESVSIGHSHISRGQQSSLSKAGRKREEIVEEQSISEIYSDNFESFSQSHVSRSNVRKSIEEIGQSIKSSMGYSQSHSHSYRK